MCKSTRDCALGTNDAMESKKKNMAIFLRELTEITQKMYNDNFGKCT